jgi:pimeloyl-ACP methyl ester carboxylesterase
VEGYLERPIGRTWYRVTGDGGRAPLVALHGGPGSTHNYFAPLERLADERPVVLYDQLGCGRSTRTQDGEWSVAVFLDELDALRAHLGFERVHLLGTSWGGMLALEHALARQDSLVSLILSSTLASAADWAAEAKRLRDDLVGSDTEVQDEFDARHFHRGDDCLELVRMRAERNKDVYRAMWGPNEWTITGALDGWDVRARLLELKLPTLVLRGAHDLSTPAISKTLLDGIPHAREVVFDDSSHTPVLEETERYLAAVRAFLYSVEAR